MKKPGDRSIFGDIRVSTVCGDTNLQNYMRVPYITYDSAKGYFEAGDVRGSATDIVNIAVNITPRNTKRLCILTKKGVVIAMESEPKRAIIGFGRAGKLIDEFQRVLPALVETAKAREMKES